MRTGFLAAGISLLLFPARTRSADDPALPPYREVPTALHADPDDSAAAAAVGISTATIARWRARGFGKTEVLILGELVRRSTWTFDVLAAARAGGATLKSLAQQCGVDHTAAVRSARENRRRIENALLPPRSAAR